MDADRRKQLKEAYKETKTYYGIYAYTCRTNGKVYVGSYSNIKNGQIRMEMQLFDGHHPCATLQRDFDQFGKDDFTYEVIEQKDAAESTDPRYDAKKLAEEYRTTHEGNYY